MMIEPNTLKRPRIAVLIDAENVSWRCWSAIQRSAAILGDIVGFTAVSCTRLGGWSKIEGIGHIHAESAASAPNAADFLLAFEAGRIAQNGSADEIAVVSGDEGFASLMQAISRCGLRAHAIVPNHTIQAAKRLSAVAATCLIVPAEPAEDEPQPKPVPKVQEVRKLTEDELHTLSGMISSARHDGDGWVSLGNIGSELRSMGIRKYSGKLLKLLAASPEVFETRRVETVYFVRHRNQAANAA